MDCILLVDCKSRSMRFLPLRRAWMKSIDRSLDRSWKSLEKRRTHRSWNRRRRVPFWSSRYWRPCSSRRDKETIETNQIRSNSLKKKKRKQSPNTNYLLIVPYYRNRAQHTVQIYPTNISSYGKCLHVNFFSLILIYVFRVMENPESENFISENPVDDSVYFKRTHFILMICIRFWW